MSEEPAVGVLPFLSLKEMWEQFKTEWAGGEELTREAINGGHMIFMAAISLFMVELFKAISVPPGVGTMLTWLGERKLELGVVKNAIEVRIWPRAEGPMPKKWTGSRNGRPRNYRRRAQGQTKCPGCKFRGGPHDRGVPCPQCGKFKMEDVR